MVFAASDEDRVRWLCLLKAVRTAFYTPLRPSEGVGREERSRTGDPGIDVMKVLLALGRRDVDLPRHLDIDGDGEVTILDLESAMRIVRSQDASPGSGRSFNARPDEPLR